MATVDTTITPSVEVFPFQGISDVERNASNVPRRELRFIVLAGSLPATGAGDNQRLFVDIDLPQNFAYSMLDYYFSIRAASNNFGLNQRMYLSDADSTGNGRTYIADVNMNCPALIQALTFQMGIYTPAQIPKNTLVPAAGSDGRCRLEMYNSTPNDNEYTVDLFARFLQYDINQANHFEVNTPQLTR